MRLFLAAVFGMVLLSSGIGRAEGTEIVASYVAQAMAGIREGRILGVLPTNMSLSPEKICNVEGLRYEKYLSPEDLFELAPTVPQEVLLKMQTELSSAYTGEWNKSLLAAINEGIQNRYKTVFLSEPFCVEETDSVYFLVTLSFPSGSGESGVLWFKNENGKLEFKDYLQFFTVHSMPHRP